MQIPAFIKWLGGKRRLIDQIAPRLPDNIDNYFEPFLGGGSMFFYVKQTYEPKTCILSDINEDLINTFITVRDNPKGLLRSLKYLASNDSAEFYYKKRRLFNSHTITGTARSATFIYLTKSCFNGVYRINKKGEFNVPYAYHKNREIYDTNDIIFASQLLQGVEIMKQDYRQILQYIKAKDLVYLDPCYDPLKRTSFVHYTKDRFSPEDRQKLFTFVNDLKDKGADVVLSNNDIPEVRKLYKRSGYKVRYVETARCVNVNSNGRGRIRELLITNY